MSAQTPSRILVIEDNAELAGLLSMHLSDAGFHVIWHEDGTAALADAECSQFDLVVLDLVLPGIDGMEICRRLRSRNDTTPVLMLTSRSSEFDRVRGLETGADDYLTKPFSFRELIARVNAILRRVNNRGRANTGNTDRIVLGNLEINEAERGVFVDGHRVDLTAREFDLLMFFARNPARVFTREQLLDAVWGYGHDGFEHTVNSHINRLRAKIERQPKKPDYIETVWGVGYRMKKKNKI